MNPKMRIIHTPVNIGAQASSISACEKKKGFESFVVVQLQAWTKLSFDKIYKIKSSYDIVGYLRRLFYGVFSAFHFDVFVFYFGRTLLSWDDSPRLKFFRHADIKLASLLNKKIFAIYQGCDIRMAAASNKNNSITPCAKNHCQFYSNCLSYTDGYRVKMYEELKKYYHQTFYLNPDLGYFLDKSAQFLPYSSIDLSKFKVEKTSNHRPLILHAPSDELVKGTSYIIKALDSLAKEFEFDFQLVKNLPHSEAIELYKKADLVIDQVLCGWYGAFGVEVMAMGKPLACYIRNEDLHFIPAEMKNELPIINISIQNLEEDLRRLFLKKEQWIDIGLRSRQFVEKWHDPEIISEILTGLYQSQVSRLDYLDFERKYLVKKNLKKDMHVC